MTMILDLDLGIPKMYLHTKTEVLGSKLSKVRAQTGQTDATERTTTPHSQHV